MSALPPPPPSRPFLPQIEALRGYAALCVALSHCLGLVFLPAAGEPVSWFVSSGILVPLFWLLNGRAAVIVFLVISGFVLSLSLDARPAHRSPGAWGAFLWRRALRIYPAHVAALALFVPLAWATLFSVPVADAAGLDAATTSLKPWVDGSVYGALHPDYWLQTALLYSSYHNPVTWTLQVEMLAAILLPLFALLTRRGSLARDVLILLLLVAGARLLIDADRRPDLLPLYLPAFWLGCMVRTHGRRLAAAAGRLAGGGKALLALSMALLVAPVALVPQGEALFATTMAISAGAFGLVSAVAWPRRPVALLLHPASRTLGRLSYSFYIWHALMLFAFVRLLLILAAPATLAAWPLTMLLATIFVTVLLALGVAALFYRWIERPFVELGRGARLGQAFGRRQEISRLGPAAAEAI